MTENMLGFFQRGGNGELLTRPGDTGATSIVQPIPCPASSCTRMANDFANRGRPNKFYQQEVRVTSRFHSLPWGDHFVLASTPAPNGMQWPQVVYFTVTPSLREQASKCVVQHGSSGQFDPHCGNIDPMCIRPDCTSGTKQNEEEDDTAGTSSQGMHDTRLLTKVPTW